MKIEWYKFLIVSVIGFGIIFTITGCEDKEAAYIANQTKYYVNLHEQVRIVADDFIRKNTSSFEVSFEFAKIQKVSTLYYIVCYVATENGRNDKLGVHVMKRNNYWQVVNLSLNWDALK